jgi:hypothetical protein
MQVIGRISAGMLGHSQKVACPSTRLCLQGICAGVQQVLAKSPRELNEMGRKARALFEADRAEFVQRMGVVLQKLRTLLDVAQAAAVLGDAQRDV